MCTSSSKLSTSTVPCSSHLNNDTMNFHWKKSMSKEHIQSCESRRIFDFSQCIVSIPENIFPCRKLETEAHLVAIRISFHQHSSISPQFSYDNLRRDYTLHQRQASAKYLVHVWAFHSYTPLQYSTYFLG